MKKNLLKAVFVAAFAMMAGYGVYTTQNETKLSDITLENVEALAAGENGATVSCYCKTNWFSNNVCSANASGSYCGGDPCSNHDGNCR